MPALKINKRIIKIIIAVLIILALILLVKKMFAPSAASSTTPAAIVNAVTAKQESWHMQIQSTGTINTFKGAMLKAQVTGPVTQIYFNSGTMVKAGAPLIQIYPDLVEAQLAGAQAQMQLDKVTYQRYNQLYQKNAVSEQALDQAYADWQKSIAQVQNAEASLREYNVTAPFDGMVGLREVSVGQYLTNGSNIVQLQQVDPIRVDFTVPDTYLDEIAVGQKLSLVPSADQTKTFDGQVTAINSAVDQDTRSISLWGSIPNPSHYLLPGSYAVVTLYSIKTHDVVVIPQTALTYDSNGPAVYKVVDGSARKTAVTIGMRQGADVSISEGLNVGEEVVSDGIIKLFDGMPVKVANLNGAAVTAPSSSSSDSK